MIGKKIGYDYYIHYKAINEAPEKYKKVIDKFMSIGIVKVVFHESVVYNIVFKVNLKKNTVSVLHYLNFIYEAHPLLTWSWIMKLNTGETSSFFYKKNNPILHRKDLLISKDWYTYKIFKELSKQEEHAGLLGRKDIGRIDSWNKILNDNKYIIEDHKLISTIAA